MDFSEVLLWVVHILGYIGHLCPWVAVNSTLLYNSQHTPDEHTAQMCAFTERWVFDVNGNSFAHNSVIYLSRTKTCYDQKNIY